jgi:hypothetical protein
VLDPHRRSENRQEWLARISPRGISLERSSRFLIRLSNNVRILGPDCIWNYRPEQRTRIEPARICRLCAVSETGGRVKFAHFELHRRITIALLEMSRIAVRSTVLEPSRSIREPEFNRPRDITQLVPHRAVPIPAFFESLRCWRLCSVKFSRLRVIARLKISRFVSPLRELNSFRIYIDVYKFSALRWFLCALCEGHRYVSGIRLCSELS